MEQIWIKDGKFNELSENEAHGLKVEEKAAYMVALNGSKMDALKKEMEAKVGTEVVDELKKQFGELKEKHVEQLEKAMEEQGKTLADLRKSNAALEAPKNMSEELKHVWNAKKDEIASFIDGKSKGFNLELKTEVTRASVADNTMAHFVEGVGQIPRRSNAIIDLFSVGTVSPNSNGVVRYWEQNSQTDNAANIAESAAYPESAIDWIERTLPVEKIGDSIPVTREALEDVDFVGSEIRNFLLKNVDLRCDQQALLGTGAANQLTGVDTIAPNWAAGNFAASIDDASIYDVISTGLVQIANAGQNNAFVPNAIIMNPEDAELMRLTKDADGNYVMPMWMTQDGMSVRGVRIIENQLVPQDEAYIGDFTFGTMFGMGGVTLDVATQHGTDWLEDVTRLKASVRKALVIRNVHYGAFLHIDGIAAAQAALETP